jgi:cytochrome c-type biogenesis protein CcmH
VHLGYTDEQITDYFVDRYGEWILLAPKEPLLWAIPAAGVLAALGMKARIKELVHLGYTDEQITDYFVDRYGEWVLLAPNEPLLWAVPAVGVLLALGALTWWLSSRRSPASPPPPVASEATDEPYRRRILRELGE